MIIEAVFSLKNLFLICNHINYDPHTALLGCNTIFYLRNIRKNLLCKGCLIGRGYEFLVGGCWKCIGFGANYIFLLLLLLGWNCLEYGKLEKLEQNSRLLSMIETCSQKLSFCEVLRMDL